MKFQREGFRTLCEVFASYHTTYTQDVRVQVEGIIVEDFNGKSKVVSIDTTPEFPKFKSFTFNTSTEGEVTKELELWQVATYPVMMQPRTSVGMVEVELEIPEGWIVLDNGEFLYNSHGKYAPNLTYICDVPQIVWNRIEPKTLNLDKGNFRYIIGDYFVSKKGSNCFRVKQNGKHILIMDDWGGCFNRYRGDTLPEEGSLYYRRAQSNGGGSGNDYAIYKKDWTNTPSLDDI